MRALSWGLTCILAAWSVVEAHGMAAIEPYSGSCLGMLSGMYNWSCDSGAEMSCYCANENFKQTVVACIDMLLANTTTSKASKDRSDAFQGVVSSCPSSSVEELEGYRNAVDSLKPLGCVAGKLVQCDAPRAFKPTYSEVYHGYRSYKWNNIQSSRTCWRYGGALLAYWAGICLIRALIYWGSKLFPQMFRNTLGNSFVVTRIRRHLTLPPLFRKHHSQPYPFLRFVTFSLPTRVQSVIVLLFFGLCMGLTFGYDMYTPNYEWRYNHSETYCYYIGKISGYLILFLLPLLIVFAGRNNFLIFLTGWTQDTFVVFHKWIGRTIVAELIIHTVVYTIQRIEQERWMKMWSNAYWNWGVVGLVAGCLLAVQAMHTFRKIGYETFLIVHILGVILFIIASYYHVYFLDGEVGFIWACVAVWGFERMARLTRVIRSSPFATALIESHKGSVLEYTIQYSREWQFEAGQCVFIHVMRPSWFWESHPFSVVAPIRESENGTLKLFMRARDGSTRKTLQRAIAKGGAFTAYVWIDGPYGHSYDLETFSEAVFITGGLGITVIFAYVQKLTLMQPQKPLSVYWAISADDPLSWFNDQINFMVSHGVDLNIVIASCQLPGEETFGDDFSSNPVLSRDLNATSSSSLAESGENEEKNMLIRDKTRPEGESKRPNVSYGRLSVDKIVGSHIADSRGSLAVLSCGPGSLMDDVRSAVTANLTLTSNFVDYIEESYSW